MLVRTASQPDTHPPPPPTHTHPQQNTPKNTNNTPHINTHTHTNTQTHTNTHIHTHTHERACALDGPDAVVDATAAQTDVVRPIKRPSRGSRLVHHRSRADCHGVPCRVPDEREWVVVGWRPAVCGGGYEQVRGGK
jgi:hypothetical protein